MTLGRSERDAYPAGGFTVLKCNKSSDHVDRKTSVMPNTLWLWVFWALSSRGSLSQMLRRWVALKQQKSCTNSEQPPIYGVGDGLFIARRQPDLICPK